MRVDLFFPVPFLVHDVEPAVRDTIHSKVFAYLESDRAKRDVTPAPEESLATSYYRPEANIIADAELAELEHVVMNAARAFLERNLQLPPRRLEIERAWINIFKPGTQEAQHTHDGSLLSCSYYVEAPEHCGNIAFPDPIGERRSYREFTQTVGENLLTRREIAFEPQPGRLVMFESWVPHHIQCNKSDKVRISIALNLRAIPDHSPSFKTPQGGPALSDKTIDDRAGGGDGRQPALSTVTPFLFNELFDVHDDLIIKTETIADSVPVVVIDNLLKEPERVRQVIGSAPATNWKHEEGGRNFVDYYDCRLRFPIRYPNKLIAVAQQTIRTVSSINSRPQDASVDVNWFMQIHEKRADFATPHCDMTEKVRRSFTCIVYLNERHECSGGTAFFRFKRSNSLVFDEAYAEAVHENPRMAETGHDYWPEDAEDHWENVGVIDMVPGRLVIFPSEYFHGAYHPENSFYEFPRLTLAFWMIT